MICWLDNCNLLVVGSLKYLFQKLQCVQNCTARLVAQLPKAARISPILQKLHWLPVEQRVTFKVLLLIYKALNNLAPVYISNLLARYEPVRKLRSTDKYLLRIPQIHLKSFADRAFSVAAPRLLNALPMDIKSVSVFKNTLKTHFFRAIYFLCITFLCILSYFFSIVFNL